VGAGSHNSFAALRRLVQSRPPAERCDLCSKPLVADHAHVLELSSRRLNCVCDACSILFSSPGAARFRRVPRRIRFLEGFHITDAQWESLMLPINLAFFYTSTAAGKVVALYPSPAGPMESLLELSSWTELVASYPQLSEMEPDVEGLLANRIREAHQYYIAPIDHCFRLVGLIRTHWRGLSGGTEAWREIGRFFEELKRQSTGGSGA